MIVVLFVDPKKPPCVVAQLKQVRLHVEAFTWCGNTIDATNGVCQIPDSARTCDACEAEIAKWGAKT